MANLLIIGEGHGEVASAGRLAARVLAKHGSIKGQPFHGVLPTLRMGILREADLQAACEIARTLAPAALLLTSDLDDACPAEVAPTMAETVRALNLPFPAAVVLFHREYETIFMAGAASLSGAQLPLGAGPITLQSNVELVHDPESKRDAKAWVGRNLLPEKVNYKPTVHQEAFTRKVDLDELRASGLSSFRRLESGLRHLAHEVAQGQSSVYPRPSLPSAAGA